MREFASVTRWKLVAKNENFETIFTGDSIPSVYETHLHNMLIAMREGLEANGYEVTITMSLRTEVEL